MLALRHPALTIACPDLLAPRAANGDPTEAELARLPHLKNDLKHVAARMRRSAIDARRTSDATAAIGRLPAKNEAIHLAIAGRFALWNVVPAVLELSRNTIDRLHIATLGFSRDNIDALVALVDSGSIGRVILLCSHYFKNTSGGIYEHAEKLLKARPACTFISARQHAKLLLIKLADRRTITVESSANLRSCKNVETMTLIGDPSVYAFHAAWIEGLATQKESEHEAGQDPGEAEDAE